MNAGFHKILIPVDFSLNTEIAVKKAVSLLETGHALIFLLHVIPVHSPWRSFMTRLLPSGKRAKAYRKYLIRESEVKLMQWKRAIEESKPGIEVKTIVLWHASVSRAIEEVANLSRADLVIIGKQAGEQKYRFFSRLSPDRIAVRSGCPVLTVKPGSIHSRTKIIVVPVLDVVPERKLELAILIAQKYRAQVHLVTIRTNGKQGNERQGQAFLHTYHLLRESLHHPVEYFASNIANPARAVLDYAEFVAADLILVSPATESGISSFTGSRHISDLLGRDSRIQVLDVQPY